MPTATCRQPIGSGDVTVTDYFPPNTAKPFEDTFDGNHKIISGLSIDNGSKNFAGLFGVISGDNTKTGVFNLILDNPEVSANSYVGRSRYGATAEYSRATGDAKGRTRVGGLVGNNHTGSAISNSHAAETITGTTNVGGLVG